MVNGFPQVRSTLFMSKIIIGIHGLGNHPPRRLLERWWKRAIREGLKARGTPRPFFRFELAYWADVVHPRPLDAGIHIPSHPLFLAEPYTRGREFKRSGSHVIKKKLRDEVKKRIDRVLLKKDMTLKLAGVTDLVLRKYFHDLRDYFSDQASVQNSIRGSVAEVIRKHQGKEILLIAHSMGSIIAYDVLTRKDEELSVDTLATIGSPLGLPVVLSKIHSDNRALQTPPGVKTAWINLADLGDRVALDYKLADEYGRNARGVGVEDRLVYNNYECGGKRNPHKSYGYLRAPETADIIHEFLGRGRRGLWSVFVKLVSGNKSNIKNQISKIHIKNQI
jgi:pimeloyl-ACP methyl ester carboxylesterase